MGKVSSIACYIWWELDDYIFNEKEVRKGQMTEEEEKDWNDKMQSVKSLQDIEEDSREKAWEVTNAFTKPNSFIRSGTHKLILTHSGLCILIKEFATDFNFLLV